MDSASGLERSVPGSAVRGRPNSSAISRRCSSGTPRLMGCRLLRGLSTKSFRLRLARTPWPRHSLCWPPQIGATWPSGTGGCPGVVAVGRATKPTTFGRRSGKSAEALLPAQTLREGPAASRAKGPSDRSSALPRLAEDAGRRRARDARGPRPGEGRRAVLRVTGAAADAARTGYWWTRPPTGGNRL